MTETLTHLAPRADATTTVADVLTYLEHADDASFATTLRVALDVEAFATLLAFEEIVDNYDETRPGHHSFVCYDPADRRISVVDWVLDVAVGLRRGLGDAEGAAIIAERFLANPDFAALVDAELERLTDALVASGAADESRAEWTRVLRANSANLTRADLVL